MSLSRMIGFWDYRGNANRYRAGRARCGLRGLDRFADELGEEFNLHRPGSFV